MRRWFILATLAVAILVAAAMTMTDMRTFGDISTVVQSVVSILVPYIGILLVNDLRRPGNTAPLLPTVAMAVLIGAAIGVFGAVASLVATLISGSQVGPWVAFAVGGVLVQIVAVLVGTGFGLLIRPKVVAFLATIVVPIGVWLLLAPWATLRLWLTPYAVAKVLLSGLFAWEPWLVVALVWGVGLNALGALVLQRRPAEDGA
jgi:hypothetical protein